MEQFTHHLFTGNEVLGLFIALAGTLTLGTTFLLRRGKDVVLITFGTTALLYGTRLALEVFLHRFPESVHLDSLAFVSSFITYLLPLPLSIFIYRVLGGIRGSVPHWIVRGALVFGVVGMLSDLILNEAGSMMTVNNMVVVLWGIAFMIMAWKAMSRDTLLLFLGLAIFMLFAFNNNLVALGWLPWTAGNEAIGFTIFLITLGIIAVQRNARIERELVSVRVELETARKIQESILPRELPDVAGIQLSVRYIPMTAVAGDFYDFHVAEDGSLILLLADVSGHGVGAALIASMLKVAFSTSLSQSHDPGIMLSRINQVLQGKLEENFITAFCVHIDAGTRRMKYAGAGHPPLLLIRTDGTLTELESKGIVLGPFEGEEYSTSEFALIHRDRLFLYTDGAIEVEDNKGELFGFDRLNDVIRATQNRTQSDCITKLLDALQEWSGARTGESFEDDLTMVVIDVV